MSADEADRLLWQHCPHHAAEECADCRGAILEALQTCALLREQLREDRELYDRRIRDLEAALRENTCQGEKIRDGRCMRCGTRGCGEARELLEGGMTR